MKVAAVQMQSGLDVAANLDAAQKLTARAARDGAGLIVLPENFALFGASDRDRLRAAEAPGDGPIQAFLSATARAQGVWLVGGTVALRASDGRAHAAALVYDPSGAVAARYDKIHLFDVDVPGASGERYRESQATAPGKEPICVATPFGRLGLAVCYDIRFPALFARLGAMGAELVAIPAAFTVPTGAAHWAVLVRARAIESLAYVVAAAQSGEHDGGRRTYGHSMIVDPWGKVEADAGDGPGIVSAEIDIMRLRSLREAFPVLQHREEL